MPWAKSNASFPTVDVLGRDVLRIYFTALDAQQNGRTGHLDVTVEDPMKVVDVGTVPDLDIGEPGDFDDCGANAFSVVTQSDQKRLYYQGWQRTSKAPHLIFSGLAIAHGGGPGFRKVARVPILDRTPEEPYMRAAPFVLQDGADLSMWYVCCTHWSKRAEAMHYNVVIRHARSSDGIHWMASPKPCLEPVGEEYAVGRPCVVVDGKRYRMWYSIRSFDRPYRIGYAESPNGLTWERMDHLAGITTSANGWDSEMVCYPFVVRVAGRQLLFYNGNRHGATGFGVAEWVEGGLAP